MRGIGQFVICAALSSLAVACGKADSEPTGPPVATNVITITATGVSPRVITVPPGSQVTFVNNDIRPHDMQSDPHPEHDDCPELKQVGYLNPSQSLTSGNLNDRRTCKYHDNLREEVPSLRGEIVIQ
jgi:plastocyanin